MELVEPTGIGGISGATLERLDTVVYRAGYYLCGTLIYDKALSYGTYEAVVVRACLPIDQRTGELAPHIHGQGELFNEPLEWTWGALYSQWSDIREKAAHFSAPIWEQAEAAVRWWAAIEMKRLVKAVTHTLYGCQAETDVENTRHDVGGYPVGLEVGSLLPDAVFARLLLPAAWDTRLLASEFCLDACVAGEPLHPEWGLPTRYLCVPYRQYTRVFHDCARPVAREWAMGEIAQLRKFVAPRGVAEGKWAEVARTQSDREGIRAEASAPDEVAQLRARVRELEQRYEKPQLQESLITPGGLGVWISKPLGNFRSD